MAAPNPVTNLQATQTTSGIPELELSWEHDGLNLDRWMLGFNKDGDWINLEPIAASGVSPYSLTIVSPPDTTWRVVALSSSGEVSA